MRRGGDRGRGVAGHGFEEDRFRLMEVSTGDRDFLPHATRQRLSQGGPLFDQLQVVKELFGNRLKILDAIGRGDELQVFPDR